MKEKIKRQEKNQGITLIALVITIIILLILAGISIATLTGENGLLGKANTAKEEHKIAQYKEELNLIIAEEIAERKTEVKKDPMIVSLEEKVLKKEWVENTNQYNEEGITESDPAKNKYLIIESKEGYEFIIEVDNEKETAKIIQESKTPGEKYTISYDPNGGVGDPKTVEVRSGFYKILEDNTYTREDYIFGGWCEEPEQNEEAKIYLEGSKYKPEKDVTLYAVWTYNVATITFDANEGTGKMEDKKVTKGDTAKLPVNTFTREDYDFVKWNTKADGTGTDYANSGDIILTEDEITLYAIWKKKPITASTIKKNPSDFYGAIVSNYTAKTVNNVDYNNAVANWKIFYADENNIYLIADDYIAYEYVPTGRNGTSLVKGNTEYSVAFAGRVMVPNQNLGVLVDYTGSDDITDERIKALNNDYFINGNTSSEPKMKAVAYMSDTKSWDGFAGNDADYAVGGPAIEMLMSSYAQKYKVGYVAKDNNGAYIVSKNGGSTWEGSITGMLNKNDSLYVISGTEKANGMWVASPPSCNVPYSNSVIYCTTNAGDVVYRFCDKKDIGFRPLICLKSGVQLEKVSEGNYKIKNNEQ